MKSDKSASSSSDSSSGSSSSLSDSEEEKKQPSVAGGDTKKSNFVVGLKEIEELRMTRTEMLKLLKHPLFTEVVTSFFVRVVCSNNTYRMCRVVTLTQAQTSYSIQGSKGKVETRHQLVCAYGKQRKAIQLSLVSN